MSVFLFNGISQVDLPLTKKSAFSYAITAQNMSIAKINNRY